METVFTDLSNPVREQEANEQPVQLLKDAKELTYAVQTFSGDLRQALVHDLIQNFTQFLPDKASL